MMPEEVEFEGCATVEAVLNEWNARGMEDPSPVFNVLVEAMRRGTEVLAPVELPEGQEDRADGSEGELTPTSGMAVSFSMIQTDDNRIWYTFFTSAEEIEKGYDEEDATYIDINLEAFAGIVLEDEDAEGFVLNAWGDGLFIGKEIIREMIRRAHE